MKTGRKSDVRQSSDLRTPPSAACHAKGQVDQERVHDNQSMRENRVAGLDMPPVWPASVGSPQNPLESDDRGTNRSLSDDSAHVRSREQPGAAVAGRAGYNTNKRICKHTFLQF